MKDNEKPEKEEKRQEERVTVLRSALSIINAYVTNCKRHYINHIIENVRAKLSHFNLRITLSANHKCIINKAQYVINYRDVEH